MFVGILFLDISKAFDCVNHDVLLCKLKNIGVNDHSCIWFHSYLIGRQQSTIINNHISNQQQIPSGVLQGSILGPMLFSAYLNDLPSFTTSTTTTLLVDDTWISVLVNQ